MQENIVKKIVFMGTPEYATRILEKILSNKKYNIVALFTQKDKKIGRKQLISMPHVKKYCLDRKLNIPIYQPEKLKGEENIEVLQNLKPDFIIVAAYGQILSKEILEIAPCINLHASILPKYRGASPIQEALLNDDRHTGVTAIHMNEGLDTGDILSFQYCQIEKETCVDELFDLLSNIAATLTVHVLDTFHSIQCKKQNNALASYCSKILKQDGLVDLSDAKKLYNTYRAYKYWPGVFLASGVKLRNIALHETESINVRGKILEKRNNSIILSCDIGSIEIFEVQAPSKKTVGVLDFLNGNSLL